MRAMRPVSVDDLRPGRDFDLRAFVVSVTVGVAATVGIWIHERAPTSAGPTAATVDDLGRALETVVFGVLVVGPLIAVAISRHGARAWTAVAVVPTVLLIALAIFAVR
jgi:hypothetical protein